MAKKPQKINLDMELTMLDHRIKYIEKKLLSLDIPTRKEIDSMIDKKLNAFKLKKR